MSAKSVLYMKHPQISEIGTMKICGQTGKFVWGTWNPEVQSDSYLNDLFLKKTSFNCHGRVFCVCFPPILTLSVLALCSHT